MKYVNMITKMRCSKVDDCSQTKSLLWVVLGIISLTAASKIYIPFQPVPVTLQNMVVFLISVHYAPALARASIFGWLMLGAVNLPVFASTQAGLSVLTGPTAGYVFSYYAIACFVPLLRRKLQAFSHLTQYAMCLVSALIVNYAMGAFWLSFFVGMKNAVFYGVMPFVLIDCVKLAVSHFILAKLNAFDRYQ